MRLCLVTDLSPTVGSFFEKRAEAPQHLLVVGLFPYGRIKFQCRNNSTVTGNLLHVICRAVFGKVLEINEMRFWRGVGTLSAIPY